MVRSIQEVRRAEHASKIGGRGLGGRVKRDADTVRGYGLAGTRNSDDNLYRRRIYQRYVSSTPGILAPSTIDDLRPRAADLRKLIQQYFPANRGARILDLGCGQGALIHLAHLAGYRRIQGVDCSPEQIAAARRLGINGVQEGELFAALSSMPENSLDCVVTFDVIEHFAKSEVMVLIEEVWRVLCPGGRWIIHAPNGESPFCSRMRYADFTHEIAFTRQSLPQLLSASGFRSVDCHEDVLAVTGPARVVRWLVWKSIRGLLRLWLAAETGDTSRTAIFSQNLLAIAIK